MTVHILHVFYGFPWGWVFPAMVVVFAALGNRFDRRVVLLMADLGQGW